MEINRKYVAIAVVASLILGWVWYGVSDKDSEADDGQEQLASKSDISTTTAMGDETSTSETSDTSAMNGPTTTAKPGATSTTASGARTSASCANPLYKTSDPNGMWNRKGYFVHNNMWTDEAGPQTLYACEYNNWYVTSTQPATTSVKTYPNSHMDFNDKSINSFNSIKSTFAAQTPKDGIYNVAYDLWINGIADKGSTELMIWTENYKQRPSGDIVATVTLGGRTWDVWKQGTYIAFTAKQNVTSGTIDLLEIMKWTMSKGYMPANSTLGQIGFGVEICSTNGKPATFTFTDSSITAS